MMLIGTYIIAEFQFVSYVDMDNRYCRIALSLN